MSIVPSSFFGMVWNNRLNKPTVPLGVMRLWDVGASWAELNKSAGTYVWTALDNRLAQATTMGVEVLYSFGNTPTFISSNPTGGGEFPGSAAPPSDVGSGDATFKAFVTALVTRSLSSPTKIKYYNFWNEPDNSVFWTGTVSQLNTMCADAAAIIRSLDPSAIIVGPSPTGNNPAAWWTSYYAAGGKPNQDAISFHTASSIATTLSNLTAVRAVMAANGDSAKPFYVTEGNWGVAQNSSFSDVQKVSFLAQEYIQFLCANVVMFAWYSWDNTTIGTLEINGVIQPAGTAYGLLYSWLVGASQVGPLVTTGGTTTVPLTLASGQLAELVWNTGSTTFTTSSFNQYQTLDNLTVHPIVANTVPINTKPVLMVQTLHAVSGNAGAAGVTISWTGAASGSTTSNSSGNYTTGAILIPGGYTFTPTLTDATFAPTNYAVTVGSSDITEINFTPTFPPTTFFVSGNAGIPGVTVSWTGAASGSVISGSQGNFNTGVSLIAGSYTFTPSAIGQTFTPTSQPVTITSSNVTGVNFALVQPATYSISGNVGIPNATVSWSGDSNGSTVADSGGNFTTGEVLLNGSYIVTPSLAGFAFSPISQNVTISSADVSNVNFTATGFGFNLSGNVSINGIPLSNVNVNFSGLVSGDLLTDGNGNWDTGALLVPGSYQIAPTLSGYSFSPKQAAVTLTNQSTVGINFQAIPTVTEGVRHRQTLHIQFTGAGGLVQSDINVPDDREGSSTVYIPNQSIPITVTPPVGIPQPGSYGTVHGRLDNNTVINNPS